MTDRDYAIDVLKAIATPAALEPAGFQVNPGAGGNVARLITTVLRAKLSGCEAITVKSVEWRGGVIAFKNFTPNARFWTKVTQNDLNGGDGLRVWVCSSVDPEKAVLHIWVLPFALVRENYAAFPEDAKHRRDLKIVPRPSGWSFRFSDPPADPPDLGQYHHEIDYRQLIAFEAARAADVAQGGPQPTPTPPFPQPVPDSKIALPRQEPDAEVEVEVAGSNRIYFGPPGTGKSHQLREELREAQAAGRVRTVTFHPEYTYSDFVGSYRPTMVYGGTERYRDATGNPAQVEGRPSVVYRFVPGPLVQMICRAVSDPGAHFYLVIEEVNRGNCAAVFGDLFQLLDRHEDGESEYAVWVEADLMAHVRQELAGLPQDAKERLEREGLFIPSNLSIFASMNTSDQSLYPMDSAMKRRWEMQYVPIDYGQAKGRRATVGGYGERDWGDVLSQINREVVRHTHSDDKQIGQWFVKGRTIDSTTFRDKVLSYLWFDVFRHSPQDLFDLGDGPYSYEELMSAYDVGRRVFKHGVLVDTAATEPSTPDEP
jgi:hypothetical protein